MKNAYYVNIKSKRKVCSLLCVNNIIYNAKYYEVRTTMLNCNLCDYYREVQNDGKADHGKASFCEFSGFVFNKDLQDLDIEYPCSDISYEQYLSRSDKKQHTHKVERIEDWRFVYAKAHIKPAKRKRAVMYK